MNIQTYLKLLRVHQWYKNGLVFLPLIFVAELLHLEPFIKVFEGFIALCLISSAGYIINDIIDRNRDKIHPEKKTRPIASGKISPLQGAGIALVLGSIGLCIAYTLGTLFFLSSVGLILLHQLYSFWLKNEPIVDVITIGVNFVVRSISGAFIIGVPISPWLVLCPFFLAIVLATGKRESEIRLLGTYAKAHKESLQKYDINITKSLMIIATTCLIVAYAIYALSKSTLLLISVPFAIYAIMRYYYLLQTDSIIGRNAEKIYTDVRSIIAILLWGLSIFIVLYIV